MLLLTQSRVALPITDRLDSVLGYGAPRTPNSCTGPQSGAGFCFWFAPYQWLVRVDDTDMALVGRLTTSLEGVTAAITNATGLRGLRLEGSYAARCLSRGCHIDFRDTAFPAGSGVRTHFLFDAAFIVRNSEGYSLYYDGSYQAAMEEWLIEACN